jgi:hypothetical protein
VKEMAKLMKRKLHLYNSPLGTPGDANKNINTTCIAEITLAH